MTRSILALALLFAATGAVAADSAPDRDARRAEWKAKAEARFVAADADRDGRLDRVEAQSAGERLARHFDRLDADADGELTREELAKARHGRSGPGRHGGRAFLAGLVKGMDDDGDGAISRAELGDKVPEWVAQFAAIDADSDGRLGRDELRAHVRQHRGGRHDGPRGGHDGDRRG